MYELLIVACISMSGCDTLKSPILYSSEEHCRHQAALIAGTRRAHTSSRHPMTYEFNCAQGGDFSKSWTLVLPRTETVVLREVR